MNKTILVGDIKSFFIYNRVTFGEDGEHSLPPNAFPVGVTLQKMKREIGRKTYLTGIF